MGEVVELLLAEVFCNPSQHAVAVLTLAGLAYVEQLLAGLSVSAKQEVDAALCQLGAIL